MKDSAFGVAAKLGGFIRSSNDISVVLMASLEHGGLMITESELCPEFFDLHTGLAGEARQKFVQYRAKVGIAAAHEGSYWERFTELVREHRAHPVARFFASENEAKVWLGATDEADV